MLFFGTPTMQNLIFLEKEMQKFAKNTWMHLENKSSPAQTTNSRTSDRTDQYSYPFLPQKTQKEKENATFTNDRI